MVHYVIVEVVNGKPELPGAPPVYEVGELVPAARPELEGVAPVLYCAEHPELQLPALRERAESDLENGLPPVVCAILECGKATGRLQQHLSNRLILQAPISGDAVFRYYDPRVFPHLGRILKTEQMDALLGPVATWTYLDPVSGWTVVNGAAEPEAAFAVTADQHARIARIELVQRGLDLLRCNGTAPRPDMSALLDAQLAKGEAHGLAGGDLLAFALHGTLVSPCFDRHPRVRAILQAPRKGPYAEAVANWSAADWEAIARESIQYQ
ncbi:DUF4123 domain-containing protein [Burkholderia cenocepacia]|uniref:DUF4123 domain-containing protein n=1 Tax=Burkholderia cenocepacia TaxID=95486 RepID=A0AAD0IVW7_9BURK|nr:DUF4123 domain-containing protein [Burkholderia cenocepacia]AWG27585.1 hypothetical protein B9Z07_01035 [Burkholderia cenocepacia]PRE36025.1 DUF4123 domain-containing protein [Burkholderia cenocepacia]HEM7882084.1 DUF4123 domain-containing protein [Burkholderia cenocepacia]